ncbi:hypothetical protein B0W81_03030 [Prochlorococcus sp. HOT_208_60]|nr:hypothetical protein B0W81_03030 [Prochlorococcus sp. HOT_208_60]
MTNIDISQENKDKFYQCILDACPKKSVKNYKGAIEDFTKAIEIDGSFFYTSLKKRDNYYSLRGGAKEKLEDYQGAIDDYTKAIEILDFDFFFKSRADAKQKLKDYQGAIDDYTKVIEIRDDDFYHETCRDTKQVLEEYHYQLSTVKKQLKDNKGADKDNKNAEILKKIQEEKQSQ